MVYDGLRAAGDVVMALYSYGPIQLWPYIVMALHSHGPIYLWPCIVMAYIVMAYDGFVPLEIYLWPYIVIALHSHGPI